MSVPRFFIIGNPRSGTSLLRSLMNAHPAVAIPPECGFLLWLYPSWSDRTWTPRDLEEFAAEVMGSRKFETWGLTVADLLAALKERDVRSYADAADAVYRAYATKRGRSITCWGDKNNYYIAKVAELRAIFPDAAFVHIVRDVRDVACSYRELGGKEITSEYRPQLSTRVKEIALEWKSNNSIAMDRMQGAAVRVMIRYEDLVADTPSVMSRVFNALSLPSPIDVSVTSHLASLDEPEEFLQWKGKLTGPVDTSSVGRFQTELTPGEIADIESIAAPMLREYGYPLFAARS